MSNVHMQNRDVRAFCGCCFGPRSDDAGLDPADRHPLDATRGPWGRHAPRDADATLAAARHRGSRSMMMAEHRLVLFGGVRLAVDHRGGQDFIGPRLRASLSPWPFAAGRGCRCWRRGTYEGATSAPEGCQGLRPSNKAMVKRARGSC